MANEAQQQQIDDAGGSQQHVGEQQNQQPDDGFTTEERAQFDAMQRDQAPPEGTGAGAGDQGGASAGQQNQGQQQQDGKGQAGTQQQKPAASADGSTAQAGQQGTQQQGGQQTAAAEAGGDEDDGDDDTAVTQSQKLGPDGKPLPRKVNWGKFHRMQTRATAAESRVRELETKGARVEERLAMINEALSGGQQAGQQNGQQGQQQGEDKAPDREKDPFAWMEWAERQMTRMAQGQQQVQQQTQQQNEDAALRTYYQRDAAALARTEPHWQNAYDWLVASRAVELAQIYFGKDLTDQAAAPLTAEEATTIERHIRSDEQEYVRLAIKNKQSPAGRMLALAKSRGWRAPAAQQQNGQQQQTNGQGGQQQAQQTNGAGGGQQTNGQGQQNGNGQQQGKPSVTEQIAAVQRGVEASTSLSQGGGTPDSNLTIEKLANMPQHEFDAYMDRLTPARQRSVMQQMSGGAG